MKFPSTSTLAATALLLVSAGAHAATDITVDLNAQVSGAQQTVSLDAGTYNFSVISGLYNGWTYQTGNPTVREAFWLSPDEGTTIVSIDLPSESNRFTSYAGSTEALDAFGQATSFAAYWGPTDGFLIALLPLRALTFDTPVTLSFGIPDNDFADNTGGVSLSISAVPEPQSVALLLAGLGVVGFVASRRKAA